LQQVTNLFLISASQLGERQIDVFGEVLLRLIEGGEPEMLAPLCRAFDAPDTENSIT